MASRDTVEVPNEDRDDLRRTYAIPDRRRSDQKVIDAAMSSFECPEGYRLCKIPSHSNTRSMMYDNGVRVELKDHTPTPGKTGIPGFFYCMADKLCRESRTRLRISNNSTSSATDHLKQVHGIGGKIAEHLYTRHRKRLGKVAHMRAAKAFKADRDRFLAIEYVKTHIIEGFLRFDFLENEDRRSFHLFVTSNEESPFPVERLDSKGVQKIIAELYHATKTTFKQAIANLKRTSPLPFFHVNVDVWSAEGSMSRDRYIGIRVFGLDANFKAVSYPLAVKLFKPGPDTDDVRAGEMVKLWAQQVLEEFGMEWSDVLGAVTDGGSDVKFDFSNIDGVLRESCLPHMLNRAMIEGFGASLSPSASKNASARRAISQVRSVVKHMNKSNEEKNYFDQLREERFGQLPEGSLQQAAPLRWLNGTTCLERFIVYYPALVKHYAEGMGRELPAPEKRVIEELYSMMKSMALVIQDCLNKDNLSGVTAMERMISLLLNDLNVDKPLKLHDASHHFALPVRAGATAAGNGAAGTPVASPTNAATTKASASAAATASSSSGKPPRTSRPDGNLSAVGREARKKLHEAVFKRFGRERWGDDFEKHSHLFDMGMALHPHCRKLGYIEKLSKLTGDAKATVAEAIREKIWESITALAERVVARERAEAGKMAASADAGGDSNPKSKKRQKISHCTRDIAREREDSGVFDSDGEEDVELSPAQEAAEAVDEWRRAKFPSTYKFVSSGREVAEFWRVYGVKHHRIISIVARSVLGAPASAAVIEREFDECGTLISGRRRPVLPAHVEMAMFLRGAFEHIPDTIPKLTEEEAREVIPKRLKDRRMIKDLEGLVWDSDTEADRMTLMRLPGANIDESSDEEEREA